VAAHGRTPLGACSLTATFQLFLEVGTAKRFRWSFNNLRATAIDRLPRRDERTNNPRGCWPQKANNTPELSALAAVGWQHCLIALLMWHPTSRRLPPGWSCAIAEFRCPTNVSSTSLRVMRERSLAVQSGDRTVDPRQPSHQLG
jgi:hypothetical protein